LKVDYIDHMGGDDRVVDAARVSFHKEAANYTPEQNDKLLAYLARHNHWTPFSHPQITLRYTVPIFVARQEFKHIVGFTRNEVSRRYVDDEPEFFIPDVWRSRPDGSVKQGSGQGSINEGDGFFSPAERVRNRYKNLLKEAKEVYEEILEFGGAPEQARIVLPQSMYTSYYITGSLAAFARFYKQRTDEHAQKEIQDLAYMVGDLIQPLYPVSWKALTE
tara:strand:- start:22826 stop:23482 length:657 start_codon:yes stop_codon:yes gene_type:complete